MKELSIEEKAKRYDEAIERAKEINNEQRAQPFNIMTSVFPELKESEDEKIRNWLIRTLKSLNSTAVQIDGAYEMMLPAIAWLEKQAEHAKFCDSIQIGDKVTRNQDGVLVNLSQLEREAKPAEEYNITGIGSKHAQGKLGEMIKNLKSAWSDEDEKILSDIIKDLVHPWNEYIPDRIEYEIKWLKNRLKSLKDRVQPKQEWSEQDNKNLKECVIAISMSEGHTLEEKEQLENWLKSLRPQSQWKPSDDEMKALASAIHCYAGISPTNNREVYALKIMKEQLKKLKGE